MKGREPSLGHRPRRILHVYKDYHPVLGGIENHIRALARGQRARGNDVEVLVTAAGPQRTDERLDGVRVSRAARWATAASTPLSPDLVLRLAARRPDLTHLHAPYPVAELGWLLGGRRPMVISYHADVVRQKRLMRLWAPGLRAVLRRAARVVAGSPAMAESSPFLREVSDTLRVVPYGIDTGRFDLGPQARDAACERWREAASGVEHWLAFVGRLRTYKGLQFLLDALPRLSQVGLMVVGTGPMRETLGSQASRLGLDARVRWLGDVSDEDLPGVLAAADAFVFPAHVRSEAFGIAMLEAMAAGLPVVSTELGTGTSWLNQHGLTGLVVAPGDPEALAEGIRNLLADPERRGTMGRAAAKRARDRFSHEAMLEGMESVYREALATDGQPGRG